VVSDNVCVCQFAGLSTRPGAGPGTGLEQGISLLNRNIRYRYLYLAWCVCVALAWPGIKHVPNKGDEARFSYFDQKSVQLSTIPKVVVGTMRFQTPYLEHGYEVW
jgi:hypothetical protein